MVPASEPFNILIVDDNAFDLGVLADFARNTVEADEVFCVRTLDNAIEAVGVHRPALIILDDHLGPVGRATSSIAALRAAGYAKLICVASAFHAVSKGQEILQSAGVLYFDKDRIGEETFHQMIYLARHVGGLWKIAGGVEGCRTVQDGEPGSG